MIIVMYFTFCRSALLFQTIICKISLNLYKNKFVSIFWRCFKKDAEMTNMYIKAFYFVESLSFCLKKNGNITIYIY